MKFLLIILVLLGSLYAFDITSCEKLKDERLDRISSIPNPIAKNTLSFNNASIRLTKVSNGGFPEYQIYHAIIEIKDRFNLYHCFVLSREVVPDPQGTLYFGFSDIDFDNIGFKKTQKSHYYHITLPLKLMLFNEFGEEGQIGEQNLTLSIDTNRSSVMLPKDK
jgi:hypothetical protein